MKMKRHVMGFLLLVLCAGIQLHAQQTDSGRAIFERVNKASISVTTREAVDDIPAGTRLVVIRVS